MADPTAETWRSFIPDEDSPEWYSEHEPTYSGEDSLDPDELAAARRFVGAWLNKDSQGFAIPGSEWGQSLLHWLNILMAHTGPYQTREESHAEWEALLARDAGLIYRVELWEKDAAELPWLRFYTDNIAWVHSAPGGWLVNKPHEPEVRLAFKFTPMEPGYEPNSDELLQEWRSRAEENLRRRYSGLLEGFTANEIHEFCSRQTRLWPAEKGA